MKKNTKKKIYIFIGLSIPFLYFISPAWIALSGVGPSWALLWLLPWSLEEGPWHGLFAGFCFALILDGLVLDGATHIPSFLLIGYWWGLIGLKGPLIEKSFNLGLLAFLGCLINGIFVWTQNIFLFGDPSIVLLNASMFHTLLAQSIITSLIAPMSCSWALLTFFRQSNG